MCASRREAEEKLQKGERYVDVDYALAYHKILYRLDGVAFDNFHILNNIFAHYRLHVPSICLHRDCACQVMWIHREECDGCADCTFKTDGEGAEKNWAVVKHTDGEPIETAWANINPQWKSLQFVDLDAVRTKL
ncbi:hypothetical protein B0H16DRAFT_1467407 [Mycena metata]|uniref:Uncharacterized protein n=1 Tax=Mycena metata TaxID=1033252 RepID=A0AAD7I4E3_9AGAR|nr:hypothetical protein B0H16DRAFT_1467407 [Mycena metata]